LNTKHNFKTSKIDLIMQYTTRERMSTEMGLSVKTFMKRLEKEEIVLAPRERISPKKQAEIKEKLEGTKTPDDCQ